MQDRLSLLILKSGLALGGLSEADRALVLAVPARTLARDAVASEAQVNALLKSSLDAESSFLGTDHVELRRWLVDARWWQRDATRAARDQRRHAWAQRQPGSPQDPDA